MEKTNIKSSSLKYEIDRIVKEKIIRSLKTDKYGNRVNYYEIKINFFIMGEMSRILNRATLDNLLGWSIQDKFKT